MNNKQKIQKVNNDVILFISDLHAPYHHKDSLPFLAKIKEKYKPTRIIGIGDEVDFHALSFHNSDPDLDSAGVELIRAQKTMQQLKKLFPIMDLVHSNHGSMVYRKAKAAGMPRHVLKPYNEVLGIGEGWEWHRHLTIKQENGPSIYVTHGSKKNSEVYARQLGCCVVQGHYHEDFRVGYFNSPTGLIWGANIGCLLDDEELAFEYNKINPLRPVLGTLIVEYGVPRLIPMITDENGNWNGRI